MKVLIADDDPTTRVVLSSLVEKMGHTTQAVEDGEAAWQIYQQDQSPCLMLVDWEMPKLDGIQLCQRIKGQSSLNPPYIILITSRTEAEDIVEGLDKGADDYICKPFNAPELMARIQVAERTLKLHQELFEARQALKYQATHDELTGLLNRRAALDLLPKEFHRAQRLGHKLHLAICDIDDFKRINDTYGHFVGDRALRSVAECMQQVFRPYDVIARFGGEEFLIAISDENVDAKEAFERLRAEVSSLPIAVEGQESVNLTVSIGVSTAKGELSKMHLDELLIEADKLLYAAKEAGKNCIKSA